DRFDIVVPSISILAEIPVATVDRVVAQRGSRDLAKAYLDFLYSPEGQRIVAEHGNRVQDETVASEFADRLPEVRLVTVEAVFGGWGRAPEAHSAGRALVDQIYGDRCPGSVSAPPAGDAGRAAAGRGLPDIPPDRVAGGKNDLA